MSEDRPSARPGGDPWAEWLRVWGLRAPWSGDVAQDIEPTFGLINLSTTKAGDPELERQIVTQVASYGRQLGRVLDALDVLISHGLPADLTADERSAIDALGELREQIEDAKAQAARDRIDRLVEDVRALRRDPEGAAAVSRL